ncbi:hypothetical protein BN14_03729 [Rhizoctonia solani AG-1 IB]|uniref:Uncharacterized protein n=1 Tax=Thanatephorus cucumeris (strain AG1-IB / isolate 7/3/14) TaxID=1108050 RepID=M5BRA8_THACB|nr:hypothetical protein BN14_03729 [Rhizoctonia solani AG-1 IB]
MDPLPPLQSSAASAPPYAQQDAHDTSSDHSTLPYGAQFQQGQASVVTSLPRMAEPVYSTPSFDPDPAGTLFKPIPTLPGRVTHHSERHSPGYGSQGGVSADTAVSLHAQRPNTAMVAYDQGYAYHSSTAATSEPPAQNFRSWPHHCINSAPQTTQHNSTFNSYSNNNQETLTWPGAHFVPPMDHSRKAYKRHLATQAQRAITEPGAAYIHDYAGPKGKRARRE